MTNGAYADEVQTTRATYDEIASAYYERSRRPADRLRDEAAQLRAVLTAGALVGDVGCGPGHHTAILRELGVRAYGFDLSEGMLRSGGQIGMVQADMRALPVQTGALDAVWSYAALLHIPRPLVPVALAEFARVVRVGGVLRLTVAEGDGEGFERDAYDGRPRWYTRHHEDGLRAMLVTVGYTVDGVSRRVTHRDWLTIAATRTATP